MENSWKEEVKQLLRVKELVEQRDTGNEMQMMPLLLENMITVSAAKNLSPGLSYFFLSQTLSDIGADTETCSVGFRGPYLNRLIDNLSNGLTSSTFFSPKAEHVNVMLLKKILKSVATLSISAGSLLRLKIEMNKDEKEKEKTLIYIKLLIKLIASSGVLKTVSKELSSTIGGNEKTTRILSEILFLISFVLIGYSYCLKTKESFALFTENVAEIFETSLKKIEELFENDKSDDTILNAIKANTIKAFLSLKNENFQDFELAIIEMIEIAGISKEQFDEDILRIKELTLSIYSKVLVSLEDFSKNHTEISVVA